MPRQNTKRSYPAGEAARLLGISLDTLRRWDRQGRIRTERDAANRRVVPAAEVERLRGPREQHELSARNRFAGVVTRVEVEAGPYRVVSVVPREAVEELGLKPGMTATAVVKATSVLLER